MNKLLVLKGGLRLALYKSEHTRSVSVGVYVGAGAINETNEQTGISHFIEHMMFKGTSSRTAFDIADEMESLGAQINAFTAREMTCYYTISTSEHLEQCMRVLSDMMFNSEFSDKEIEKEKNVVLEEISRSLDDPEDVCAEGLATAFYGDTSMGRPILGSPEHVKGFTRNDIVNYIGQRYVPSATVISIAGYFDEDRALELVNELFADKFVTVGSFVPAEHVEPQGGSFVKFKDFEQASIGFAFPGYDCFNELADTATLVANVFGGAMSSRLFQTVREQKGLVYDIYSTTGVYRANGSFGIYFGTNPSRVGSATSTVRDEIIKLINGGLTQKELNKGIEQLKSATVLGAESSSAIMRANGRNVLLKGELFDVDKRISNILAITEDKAAKVISEIFDFGSVASSYVGPETDFDIHRIIKGEING